MKIRDVKTYRHEAALVEPFAYSQAWYERRGALLVEIVAPRRRLQTGGAVKHPQIALLRSRDSASVLIKAFGSRIKNASLDELD